MYHSQNISRLSTADDINVLKWLDLQTHQYPLHMPEWRDMYSAAAEGEVQIMVLHLLGKAIGFIAWRSYREEKFDHVLRLGVLPNYRRSGAGRTLMQACYTHAYNTEYDWIKIVVPDVNCSPGDPDDVSGFLTKIGFHATGEIITGRWTMYGSTIDGYIFRKDINVTPFL